jgi:molecular chaperone DnaJ
VRVNVRDHPIFSRGRNGDLIVTVPVTFDEAALGAQIEVPTLGSPVTVKVPAGSRSGRTLRVKGRGVPRPGGGKGDLLAKIEVEVPQKLTRREKQLLEEFRSVHRSSPRERLERFMQREPHEHVS